jgi:hypothetical protein
MSRQVPARNGGTLTRPDKGETMNPNGRPRLLVADVLKDMKAKGITPVTKQQIIHAYESLLNMAEADIVAIVNNKEVPYFVRLVASAMTTKGKGFEIIERMLDRTHGRPTFNADLTSGGDSFMDIIKKVSGKNDKAEEK